MTKDEYIDRIRANVPTELRELDQWVCWRLEPDPGKKPKKVPYAPLTGYRAKPDTPSTWASFDDAVAAYLAGSYDYIGLMFSEDDPYTGVDLDSCVADGVIEPRRAAWLDMLDSYSEFSQSGEGTHTIVNAQKTGDKCRDDDLGVEIYDHARGFVFTGDHVPGTPRTIQPRQAEIDALYTEIFGEPATAESSTERAGPQPVALEDDELWRRMFASKRGGEIRDLFDGKVKFFHKDGTPDGSSADQSLANYLAFWTGRDAPRMDRMFRQTGLCRDKWLSREDYRMRTIQKAIDDTPDIYTPHIHRNGAAAPTAEPDDDTAVDLGSDSKQPQLLTAGKHDYGNAVTARQLHGDKLLFTAEQGWMAWTKTHWSTTKAEAIVNAAVVDTLKQRHTAALDANDLDLLRATTPSNKRIRDAKEQLRYLVMTSIDEFDHVPHLLNCANGVVDLRTGDLVAHERSNRFSYCVGTDYEPGATSDLWLDLNLDWFGGDLDRVQYVQRAMGYSVTGDTREECLFYLWGPLGRNGKGTLANTVSDILGGPLAKGVSFTAFQNERSDPQGFQIAPLYNARMVVASEGDSTRLNASLLKVVSGRDTLQVSFKGRTPFQLRPRFKIWLMSNHPIKGDPDDDAFWRRFRLIQFAHSYIGKEDRTLKGRLLEVDNRKGILAWVIYGAIRWYAMGMGEPSWMATELQQHRSDNDGIGRFLADHTEPDPAAETGLDVLYIEYKNWCDDEGIKPQAKNWLSRKLKAKGFETRRDTKIQPAMRYIKGLRAR